MYLKTDNESKKMSRLFNIQESDEQANYLIKENKVDYDISKKILKVLDKKIKYKEAVTHV